MAAAALIWESVTGRTDQEDGSRKFTNLREKFGAGDRDRTGDVQLGNVEYLGSLHTSAIRKSPASPKFRLSPPTALSDRFHGTYPPNFNEGTHLISGGPLRFVS